MWRVFSSVICCLSRVSYSRPGFPSGKSCQTPPGSSSIGPIQVWLPNLPVHRALLRSYAVLLLAGVEYTEPKAAEESVTAEMPPPDNFLLMLLWPQQTKYLNLKSMFSLCNTGLPFSCVFILRSPTTWLLLVGTENYAQTDSFDTASKTWQTKRVNP